jgi:hypothetical protein
MPLLKGSLAATVLMAACCLSVPATSVRAQSPSPDRFTPAPELSDQKLEAAAAALERVSALQKDYKQRVAEAKAPAEKERIVTEANNEVTKAVTDQGLSVEEYVAILEVARDDAAVRGRLLQRIRPVDK